MKSLASIWESEARKREKQKQRTMRCDRNWPLHKAAGLAVFKAFADIAKSDGVIFHVVDYRESQRDNEYGPWTVGEDSIVLGALGRPTGKQTHYESLYGSHSDYDYEKGGSLVVHYTERQAAIHVFLSPPKPEGSLIEKKEVLLWAGYNTDRLTPDFYRSLIRKFLVFCRVESSLDNSTFIERCRVRWWKYMDVRNRRNLFGTPHNLLNAWELSAVAALFATVSLLVSIIAL